MAVCAPAFVVALALSSSTPSLASAAPPSAVPSLLQEALAESYTQVAAVFDGDRYLGLVNQDDIREALQISAFLRLAWEKRTLLERREAA